MTEVVLRVFVSSPSDVEPERARVAVVAERLNGEFAGRARVDVQRWNDKFYVAGASFQQGIMKAMDGLAGTDMVVCVVWKRVGTELDPLAWSRDDGAPYESGTVLEYEAARQLAQNTGKPELYLFRKTAAVLYTAADAEEQMGQHRALQTVLDRWTRDASGRNVGAFQQFADTDDFEQQVEGCMRQWLQKHGVARLARTWDRKTQGSPFRGLESFDAGHAKVFFGRDADVTRAVAKLQLSETTGVPFLLLVGASGAGKSSVLRAGLRQRITLPGSFPKVAAWRSCLVVPSADPLRSLADALFAPEALGPELAAGELNKPALLASALVDPDVAQATVAHALGRIAANYAQAHQLDEPRPARLLICVDQVERVLLEAPADLAVKFGAVIRVLVEQRLATVVMALRSDTYAKFLNNGDLAALLERGGGRIYNLLPPSHEELVEIVNKPVHACDPLLAFETKEGRSLADVLVGDVQGGDALPLLQMTLQNLFEAEGTRNDGLLQFNDYPGIAKAVENTADAAYGALGAAAQRELRGLLAAMVSDVVVDEQGVALPIVTPVDREKFVAAHPSRAELVKALIDRRLLTSQEVGGKVFIRPVHDAFLRTWPRASTLIAEHAPLIHVRHTLEPMVIDWQRALDHEKSGHVATGALLAGASALQDKMGDVLGGQMLAFIDASRAAASRLKRRTYALAAAAVVAMATGALVASNARTTQAAQLVVESKGALSRMDYARAEIAAAAALKLRDLAATRELLLTARLGGVRVLGRSPEETSFVFTVFNRSGNLVATVQPPRDGKPPALNIASASDGKVLWHAALPSQVLTVDAIAFSEDAGGARQLAVSWSADHATTFHVGLWTLRDGQPAGAPRELPATAAAGGHAKRIPALAFHPRQPWLATGGEDGKLTLWDPSGASLRLLWQREGAHAPNVHGIAFSHDGKMLASGGGDYTARVWQVADMLVPISTVASSGGAVPEAKYQLSGHRDSVFAIAFSPDGKRLATGGHDRTVRIWDLTLATKENGVPTVATLSGHDGTILSIAYSEDGHLLSSGASDGSAALWDAATWQLMNRIQSDDGIVRSVATPRFEDGIHVGGEHGWSVWSVSGNPVVARLWNGGATVGNIAFDSTGKALAAAGDGDKGRVRVWDTGFGKPTILDPQVEGEAINSLAFSPDGRWLAAAGTSQAIHVWERKAGWPKVTMPSKDPAHLGIIWGLCFDRQSRWLASSNQSPDVQIKRWRTSDWGLLDETPKGELQDSVYALACDATADRLVSGDSKEAIVVRETGKLAVTDRINTEHPGELNVWSVALMRSPHAILSGHADGRVRRWTPAKDGGWTSTPRAADAATSDKAAEVNPTINTVSYDAKHGWVAAGGVGPSVEIYDANDLHWLRSLRGHGGTIWWVSFDDQGDRLAYGGLDGIVRVIHLESMLKVDKEDPAQLFAGSEQATGLTVKDGVIVRRGANAKPGH
ncbi:hypothetical protein LXT12_26370 [Pelomonas sp. P7]|uniref:Novel STAND NTPase 1 domain-containing protein n=1 Tax=Pelomonas caseinilytica TaxID=2906763 RepID=A0ABS8XIT6_9BURK|nr:hypothetical protein [Pelomonas sp. P7]MCE4540759.1 hypothetical protein [Pelomonas sp. P7]